MKQMYENYDVQLAVRGPVFIGSSHEIQKKEYTFLPGRKIGITDAIKLYMLMKEKGLAEEFEEYLLSNSTEELGSWCRRQRIESKEISSCVKYTLERGDLDFGKQVHIMECIKDSYGRPYIPGSSLKGMFRTILLSNEIISHSRYYSKERDETAQYLYSHPREKGKKLLSKNAKNLEMKAFHTLDRPGTKWRDAVNDCMSGFIVSDSEPLTTDDLILCQKIDRHTNGREKKLNMVRECIKPGTVIHFSLTIERDKCSFSADVLRKTVEIFAKQYEDNFLKSYPGVEHLKKNTVFLGGGSGFVSKTIIYPLYGHREGVRVTQKIFENTPFAKKHRQDVRLGVSPHVLKCTRYQGKYYQMGQCEISFDQKFPAHG